MAARWNPPGFVFRPTGMTFAPSDPSLPHQALDSVQWDGDALGMLLGRTVFVGVTFHDGSGAEFGRTQFAGRIVACSEEGGVLVRADDGEELLLPPWPNNFRPMMPGVYRARTSGAEIIDPDLGCFWEVHREAEPD